MRGIPRTKDQWRGKCFQLMTSSSGTASTENNAYVEEPLFSRCKIQGTHEDIQITVLFTPCIIISDKRLLIEYKPRQGTLTHHYMPPILANEPDLIEFKHWLIQEKYRKRCYLFEFVPYQFVFDLYRISACVFIRPVCRISIAGIIPYHILRY